MKTVRLQVVKDLAHVRGQILSGVGPNLENSAKIIPETVNLEKTDEVQRARLNIQAFRRAVQALDDLAAQLENSLPVPGRPGGA